jgi:hypothetical protein
MLNLLVVGDIHSDWLALKTISEYIGIFHGTYDNPDETRYLDSPTHHF